MIEISPLRRGAAILQPDRQRVYVTTAIPYVNARPHIGFGLELVLADAIARSQRLLGGQVRLQSGTDENAAKNVEAARQQGVETRQWVDAHAALFEQSGPVLGVELDVFVRTSHQGHHRAVQQLWEQLAPGDLYRRRYRGLYCVGCEDFLQGRDLVNGVCPDHGTAPNEVEEENVFFRLSRYQGAIADLIESGRLAIVPDKRRGEILAFVRGGLQDISISRLRSRVGQWGVGVPGDADQVVYVWIDALVNYLTGLGFGQGEAWRQWWNGQTRKVHVIGKNVWKFHALYWPALLLSAGLPLPDELVVHGFVTQDGRKISKSRGGGADPVEYAARYGSDALRYYLLKVPAGEDGDFSAARLAGLYRSDLANGLGNLLSRVTALAVRSGVETAPPPDRVWPKLEEALWAYRFERALELLWQRIGAVNRQIDQVRPWESDGGSPDRQNHIGRWLAAVHTIGYWLGPLLPVASAQITQTLAQRPVERAVPLFAKIESNEA